MKNSAVSAVLKDKKVGINPNL